MWDTQIIMGMPITVGIITTQDSAAARELVFDYFQTIDQRYSPFRPDSEVSHINNGLKKAQWSAEMKQLLQLCEQTKQQTDGYFDVYHNGRLDPSGLVKGWAINNAAQMLYIRGYRHFYIDAGGDIQVHGKNEYGTPWTIGIRNPFDHEEIVKSVQLTSEGIATSGTAIRGQHIYNPRRSQPITDIVALTVIGPSIYEADRFATAAFAMGAAGIQFIDSLDGFEGYMIDVHKIATMTRGFERYVTV
ncbi:MAG: FAD:protein FMN transferase [Candidatus Saccharimonadales bacterium]